MKLWIGSSDETLTDTLKAYFAKRKLLQHQHGNYYRIELPRTALQQFARELSVIFTEALFPKILISAIRETAPDLPKKEKEEVLQQTVIRFSKNGDLEDFCRDVADRILLLTYESDTLTAEGIFFFRCGDLLKKLRAILEQTLEEYRSAKEKHRLLGILRQYSEQRPPRLPFLKVIEKDGGFLFCDAHSRRIITVFLEEYTPEEYLLNTLLYLSPTVIDLSQLDRPELRDLLEEIFPQRIQT